MKKNEYTINCRTELLKSGSLTLIILPKCESEKLHSRGMVLIEGTMNNYFFQALLDPDGKGSHWFKVDEKWLEGIKASAGDTVTLKIQPSTDWPEPTVPPDMEKLLQLTPEAYSLWKNITPMARWDWLRWIGSARKPETRRGRIDTAIDKLNKGERRPCCFNRNLCTDPSVSKNGILLDPS